LIGGLVLAAGEGSRFGGPKQVAELDGRPLLEHALRAMSAAPGVERVVVVLGAHADEVIAKVDIGGAIPVLCEDWREGQAASLRAGLAELGDVTAAVVTLGDQPLITSEVIALALAEFDGERPVRTTYDGKPGHPVVLPGWMIPKVMELEGDRGARLLLEENGALEVEAGHLASAADVDTPDDLEVLRK
jgi:CTP:molybdopterin cytidylyltransferase MocA